MHGTSLLSTPWLFLTCIFTSGKYEWWWKTLLLEIIWLHQKMLYLLDEIDMVISIQKLQLQNIVTLDVKSQCALLDSVIWHFFLINISGSICKSILDENRRLYWPWIHKTNSKCHVSFTPFTLTSNIKKMSNAEVWYILLLCLKLIEID